MLYMLKVIQKKLCERKKIEKEKIIIMKIEDYRLSRRFQGEESYLEGFLEDV